MKRTYINKQVLQHLAVPVLGMTLLAGCSSSNDNSVPDDVIPESVLTVEDMTEQGSTSVSTESGVSSNDTLTASDTETVTDTTNDGPTSNIVVSDDDADSSNSMSAVGR